ncbi:MAG: hypothetical protein ACI8UR_000512 [Natronomonas sp.]
MASPENVEVRMLTLLEANIERTDDIGREERYVDFDEAPWN